MLSGLDYAVLVAYFVIVSGIGFYLAKKASANLEEYFLGGRHIPWYFLGIAGMVTYIDISGTMVQASYYYIFGVKGYWVAYRGAVALALAFLMVFIGKWLTRSRVMTNAEWMLFRFGKDRQGQIAGLLSAISILITAIAFVALIFVGSGKFLAEYIPFLSPNMCGVVLLVVVTAYTVASGFYGVVFTDLFQGFLVLFVILFLTVKGMIVGGPEYLAKYTTAEWLEIIPRTWKIETPAGYENLRFLSLLILFWLLNNVFLGFGQPHDAWTSQKFYAAKNERESSLVAFQWIILFPLRFLMFTAIAILAVGISHKISDPEMALQAVIAEYVPAGIKGLVLASLLAAAMSTLDGILNSSAAYFVRDIYQKYCSPASCTRHLVTVGHVTTVALVLIAVLIGWTVPNINSIWAWIAMGLLTGLIAPNIFKWIWWRFNGMGFAYGMGFGILAAIIQGWFFSSAAEYTIFTFVFVISTIGTIIGTFLGKPTDMDILVNFYKTTRPFGFWGPVRAKCDPEMLAMADKENRRDLWLLIPACIFQLCWIWLMTAIVARKWYSTAGTIVTLTICSVILYKYWYKNLKHETC